MVTPKSYGHTRKKGFSCLEKRGPPGLSRWLCLIWGSPPRARETMPKRVRGLKPAYRYLWNWGTEITLMRHTVNWHISNGGKVTLHRRNRFIAKHFWSGKG